MKKILVFIAALVMTTLVFARVPSGAQSSIAPMLKNVMPAVVNVAVRGRLKGIHVQLDKKGPNVNVAPKFAGVGSGVIIDAKKGYIITNAHVVKDAKVIIVTLNDQRRLMGTVIGSDEKSDIAVIKIHAKHLTAIPFGDSDTLKIGDYVTAIGNPFGLGQTVTSGIVSGLHRSGLGIEGFENFIQTDAPINPGNSGGALVNMQGQLIGINTAIISPADMGGNVGIGFSIPSNMSKTVVKQIIKYGTVEHSVIGVLVQNITPALADAFNLPNTDGALVAEVNHGSPAKIAGLKSEDVITKINGKNVYTASQISNTIGLMRPGTKISMTILRNKRIKTLHAVTQSIKEAKKTAADNGKSILSGFALQNFSRLIDGKPVNGVRVVGIDDFSNAYSYGLRPGDVIVEAENKPITNMQQLKKIAAEHPNKLLLKTQRGPGSGIYVVLEK